MKALKEQTYDIGGGNVFTLDDLKKDILKHYGSKEGAQRIEAEGIRRLTARGRFEGWLKAAGGKTSKHRPAPGRKSKRGGK